MLSWVMYTTHFTLFPMFPAPTYIVDTTSADLFTDKVEVSYTTVDEKKRYDAFVDEFALSVSTAFLRFPFDSTPITSLVNSLYDVIWPVNSFRAAARRFIGRVAQPEMPHFLRKALTALSALHQPEVAQIAQNALILLQDIISAEKRTGVVWEAQIEAPVSDILSEVDSELKQTFEQRFRNNNDFKELVTRFATWITNNEVGDLYEAVAEAYPSKRELTKDVCVMLRLYRRSTIDAFKRRLQLTYTVSRELIVGTILDPVEVNDLSSLFSLTPGEIRAKYEQPFDTLLEQTRRRVARGSELLKRHAARPVFDDRAHLLHMLATGVTDAAEDASLEVLPMISQLSVPTLNRFQQRVAKLYKRLSSPRYAVLPPLSDSDITNVLSVAQTLYNETSDLSAPEYNPVLPSIPVFPDDQLKKVEDYTKQLRKWCAIEPVAAPRVDFPYGEELVSLLGDKSIRDGKPIGYYLELMTSASGRYDHGVHVLTQLRSLVPSEAPPDNIPDEYYTFIYGIRDAIEHARPLSNVPMWCALIKDYAHHNAIIRFVEDCCGVVSTVAKTDKDIVLTTHNHFVKLKRLSLLYGILYVSVANDLDRRISPGVITSCLHEIDVAIRQQTKLVLSEKKLNLTGTKLKYYLYNPLYRVKMPTAENFTNVAAWSDILREVSEDPIKWEDYSAVVSSNGRQSRGHAASAFEADITLHMDHDGHDFSDDEKETSRTLTAVVDDVVVEESAPLDVHTLLPNDDEFI